MDGRAQMAGVDLTELPIDRALNVIAAMMTDDHVVTTTLQTEEDRAELFTRFRARRELLDSMGDVDNNGYRETWDASTWGTLPEHRAATRAALAFAGGPVGGAP